MGLFSKKKSHHHLKKQTWITYQPDMTNARYRVKGRSIDGYGKELICPAYGFNRPVAYANDKNEEIVICQNCDAILKGVKLTKINNFYEFSNYP